MIVGLLGGAGFIGTWLNHELLGRGHGVWLAGRRGRFGRLNYYDMDVSRQWRVPWTGLVSKPWKDCTAIVNLIRPDDVRAAFLTSVCIRHWGVPVIQVSSTAVYGPGRIDDGRVPFPRSRYGWAKLVQDIVLPDCVVRLPHVWGSEIEPAVVLDRWLIRARRGESLMVYDADRWFDFVHVRDVAKILADLVETDERPGKVLVGTGTRGYRLVDLAGAIGRFHNVPVAFVNHAKWKPGAGQRIVPSLWLCRRGLPRTVEEVLPWLAMDTCKG